MTATDEAPLEPPWWTPRKVTVARRSLSREAIVAAALKVLRADGIDAMSMRRVASELGTGAASLYAHVAHKDELLELVFDQVVAEVPLPEPDPARWREQITQIWTDSYATLARNGDIARASLGRIPLGPNALRISETSMAILRCGGVPDQAVAWAVDVVSTFVAGRAVEDVVEAELQRAGRDPAEYYTQIADYFGALPPGRYPVMAALASQLTQGGGDDRFAFGLRLLVDGLAAQVGTAGPVARPWDG